MMTATSRMTRRRSLRTNWSPHDQQIYAGAVAPHRPLDGFHQSALVVGKIAHAHAAPRHKSGAHRSLECSHPWRRGQLVSPRMRRLEIGRSEEHTSELQSLMRISYAVFFLKKTNKQYTHDNTCTLRLPAKQT